MFEIREALRSDMDEVLAMIRELAEYEKMSDQVKFSDEDFIKNIFERKFAKALVILVDGKYAGYAIYYFTFSTFEGKGGLYLEDIYVRKEYRNKGIGKRIFKKLAKICVENDLSRFEWICLKWNTPSIKFYESTGARGVEGWINFRLDGKRLEEFATK